MFAVTCRAALTVFVKRIFKAALTQRSNMIDVIRPGRRPADIANKLVGQTERKIVSGNPFAGATQERVEFFPSRPSIQRFDG